MIKGITCALAIICNTGLFIGHNSSCAAGSRIGQAPGWVRQHGSGSICQVKQDGSGSMGQVA